MKFKKIILIICISLLNIYLIATTFNIKNNYNLTKVVLTKKTFETCNSKEEIYRNNDMIYYLNCYKSNDVIIKLSNGDEYSLKKIIDNNLIDLDTLINGGLKIDKVPIKSKQNTILSVDEINKYNEEIKSKTNKLYNIDKINNLSKEDVLNYIESYKIPTLPKYDGSKEITDVIIANILDNRNIEKINKKDKFQKGLVVNRANLRSFPSNIPFYDNINSKHDRLQESEVHINTPVIILHTSKDNLWYFVITPYYYGWIEKRYVAISNEEEYNFFINNKDFAIITDSEIEIDGIKLDMSVKLPIKNKKLIIPIKNNAGLVERLEIKLNNKEFNYGYLPYTKENVIKQAKKYLNTNYSWGGLNNGVDCSSFIKNVYGTFGFIFPRNTKDQKMSIGKVVVLTNMDNKQKLDLIKNTELSILFEDKHVMLYLGVIDNKYYIIHANELDMKVNITKIDNRLNKINQLVLVNK